MGLPSGSGWWGSTGRGPAVSHNEAGHTNLTPLQMRVSEPSGTLGRRRRVGWDKVNSQECSPRGHRQRRGTEKTIPEAAGEKAQDTHDRSGASDEIHIQIRALNNQESPSTPKLCHIPEGKEKKAVKNFNFYIVFRRKITVRKSLPNYLL